MERTALVRAEAGERQVSALELMRLADELRLPVAHFVTRAPAAVTSRRQPLTDDADAASRNRFRLDADLETHARDARWLVDQGLLAPPPLLQTGKIADISCAIALAQEVRRRSERGLSPIASMAEFSEQFALYIAVVDRDIEGASILFETFGVAVIGGHTAPGRRRFTAAHELGHHLLQDAYHTDIGVAASEDDREQLIDAFAAELLLPAEAVISRWGSSREADSRHVLIDLAGRYRVSWSVAIGVAQQADLIDQDVARRLRVDSPLKGDFLAELGYAPEPDLEVGQTGPSWRKAVVAAWQQSLITGPRAVELLHGAITVDELPARLPIGDLH
jgi:Zn-dependent peptidase ImmA (M78 family)